ncbi:MAG: butyryl-CoA:acetate CoA-transferase, partial [Lachnospiraceae bacterium]|nr:butyryl-CoA:acetate CoA-transferase [Lachnospiraceae bacterium]
AMAAVTPMDRHGYFNLSCATGVAKGILDTADIVILEVNEHLPKVCGGFDESIHISQVDYVVEGEHDQLPELPIYEATPEDRAIAKQIIPLIPDGAILQLGIGGMPDTIGRLLADSDLHDLGMHTELCTDAYHDLYEAGKLTNATNFHRGKGFTGIALGSRKFYDWIDENPSVVFAPLEFVNTPELIGRLDNMISINNCIAVDLFGQISAESVGLRQISGTGGQLDYLTGAAMSRGGKAFICMTSTYTDREGEVHSRIVPYFKGDIVTDPRSQAFYLATEYGLVNLVGRTTWERAEMLISIAHPDFRDQLILQAERMGVWRRSNRR